MTKNICTSIKAIISIALISFSGQLTAQQVRYKLIDLGTLGGPHSYGEINGDGIKLLNNSGVVGSYADTAALDPNAPNCNVPDCYLAHAFRWKDGIMTDIGALPGTNFSGAGSTNARGWMAGQSSSSVIDPHLGVQEGRAVLWTDNGIVDLGDLPGGTESLSVYVSDSGQVVGFSDNGIPDENSFFFFPTGTQIRTFVWEHGTMLDIGTLGGASAVPGVNCINQPPNIVVGASFVNDTPNALTGVPTVDPFLWKNGKMTNLGSLGGTIGFAQCSNSRQQVIGASDLSGDVKQHAFLWEKGTMNDLGTLGGDNSEAIWINERGWIVGSADLPGPGLHDAVIWRNGIIQDLGTVDGDACSRGRGLNARGQVVGGSSDCRNFLHAFVWEEGGPMLDLNTLIAPGSGWQVTNAFNIDERGEILAKAAPLGFTPNDDADLGHLVLLIPCREHDSNCGGTTAATVALQNSTARGNVITQPDSSPQPRSPLDNVAAWRAKFAKRYPLPGGAGTRLRQQK